MDSIIIILIVYRVKPKLDELGSLHARHLMRPSLDDKCEEEELIENLSQHISKLISSTHRHIQCIRSSLGQGKPLRVVKIIAVLWISVTNGLNIQKIHQKNLEY